MVDSDKKYLKISEAAKLSGTKEHILRYWEKNFDQLKPIKRNNRRYYQQKDLDLILLIKDLLMVKKFTLDGARKIIAQGKLDNQRSTSLTNQPQLNQTKTAPSKPSQSKAEQVPHNLFGDIDGFKQDFKGHSNPNRNKTVKKNSDQSDTNKSGYSFHNPASNQLESIKKEIISDLQRVLKVIRD